MLDRLIQAATDVATPLGLAGLFGLILLLCLRQVLKIAGYGDAPALGLARLVVDRLTMLCAAAMLLGFVGFALTQGMAGSTTGPPSGREPEVQGLPTGPSAVLVRGIVVDGAGRPIGRVAVTSPGLATVYTDTRGHFILPSAPLADRSTVQLRFSKAGFLPATEQAAVPSELRISLKEENPDG